MLVVADEKTLGIGGKSGFARTGESEEDRGVFALHIGVCRAVHGRDALEREIVVHHREHTLLHFAAVPGDVEHNRRLGVKAKLFEVFHFCLGRVVHDKVRFEVFKLFLGGSDEHIGDKVCLPCHFHDETDCHARVFVCAAECIDNVEFLVGKLVDSDFLHRFPCFLACRMVVVLVAFGSPPHRVLGVVVHDDEFVLWRAAGVDARHNVDCAEFAHLTFLKARESRIGLFFKKKIVGRIVHDLGRAADSVLCQVDIFHNIISP